MSICRECYSKYHRITPLLNPEECLQHHMQYVCGTCGRCICIGKDEKRGLQRWNFPFKSLDIAILYLRTADVTNKINCGVYEIISKNYRKSFKIFPSKVELVNYLSKNKDKSCESMQPLFKNNCYLEFPNTQIKKLTIKEIKRYLDEKKLAK